MRLGQGHIIEFANAAAQELLNTRAFSAGVEAPLILGTGPSSLTDRRPLPDRANLWGAHVPVFPCPYFPSGLCQRLWHRYYGP